MLTTSLSVICTVIVLNLHHNAPSKTKVPDWIKKYLVGVQEDFKNDIIEIKDSIKNSTYQNGFCLEGIKAKCAPNENKDLYLKKRNSMVSLGSHEITGSSLSLSNEKPNFCILKTNETSSNSKNEWDRTYSSGFTLTESRKEPKKHSLVDATNLPSQQIANITNKPKVGNGFLFIESTSNNENKKQNPFKFVNNSFLIDNKNNTINTSMPSIYDDLCTNVPVKNVKHLKVKSPRASIISKHQTPNITLNGGKSNEKKKTKKDRCCLYEILFSSNNRLSLKKYNHLSEFERNNLEDWKLVASCLDKLLFWIFLIITVIFTIICLVLVPSYQNYKVL